MDGGQTEDPLGFKPEIGYLPKQCADLIEPDEQILWIGAPSRKLLHREMSGPLLGYLSALLFLIVSGTVTQEQVGNPATVLNIMLILIIWILVFEVVAYARSRKLYAITDRALYFCRPKKPLWDDESLLVVRCPIQYVKKVQTRWWDWGNVKIFIKDEKELPGVFQMDNLGEADQVVELINKHSVQPGDQVVQR